MDNKIKEIRIRMGLSQDEFCRKLDIPKTTYLRYESGEREAPAKVVAKIARLGNVSMEYIIYGEDATLNGYNVENSEAGNVVSLNLYEDIYASAGYGVINGDFQPTKLNIDKTFLEKILGIKRFSHLDIIRVAGDSMLPAIRDGEYVIIDRETEAKNGDTVIANLDGELYIKRLYRIPFEKWLRLESENQDYPNIDIDTSEKLELFHIIGVVRCKIKLF